MITLSICVSDIPKDAITTNAKNGKKYLSVVVDNLREPDKFGNTHCVKLSQSKDDRANKVKPTYIGNGKDWGNQYSQQQTQSAPTRGNYTNSPVDDSDDIPF